MGYKRWELDKKNIQRVLDCFVMATNVYTSYFNEDCDVIVGGQKSTCPFCQKIQELPAMREACIQCDIAALDKAQDTRRVVIYKCHMGLWEGVVPLYIHDHLVGYFFTGQLASEQEQEMVWRRICRKLKEQGLLEEQIKAVRELYAAIPVIEEDKFRSSGLLLEMLASFIIKFDYIQIVEMGKIETIKKHIAGHLERNLTLEELADIAELSVSYMSTLFKKMTGQTIGTYINRQRLLTAKGLLSETSLSIKEIAEKVGYDNQNYFSRVFKKYEGVSASEYREGVIHAH